MKKLYILALTIILILLTITPAFSAIGAEAMGEIYIEILDAALKWQSVISRYALGLMGVVAVIAFVLGCKDLILGGSLQLESVVALLVRQILVVGFMTWILRNPYVLMMIPKSLTELGVHAGGANPTLEGAEVAFQSLITPLSIYYHSLHWLTEPGEALVCIVLIFFIYTLMVLFATTILLVQIETIFILIGGMITAAFFVLGYFRDVFMGYIKALFMNGLKLLLLALVLGFFMSIMSGWGAILEDGLSIPVDTGSFETDGTYTPPINAQPRALYTIAIPMVFGLLAFYVILKSVPQYAIAILTGHASADGGLARAAVMAGVGTAATVWNVSRGVSNTAMNTASTVNNAAQAYKNTASSIIDSGGSTKQIAHGALSAAIKTLITSPIGGRASSGGKAIGGSANSGGNEMKPGGALFNDAYKAQESYNQEMGGKK